MKVCPKCKTENPKAANFCRHCQYEFPEGTKDGTSLSPQIHSFKIQEDNYTIGSVVNFEWTVENANIIKLNDYDVPSDGTAQMTVEKAETIILSAENDYDKTERSIRLLPRPLPLIRSFSSSHSQVRSSQDIKLKWDVRNTVRASIITSEGEIDVSNRSFIKIKPTKTGRFWIFSLTFRTFFAMLHASQKRSSNFDIKKLQYVCIKTIHFHEQCNRSSSQYNLT